jgi:hypothetical protein
MPVLIPLPEVYTFDKGDNSFKTIHGDERYDTIGIEHVIVD